MAVFSPGKAHHDLVAVLDHAEVGDRLADLVAQALGELVVLVLDLARIECHRKIDLPPSTAMTCPVTYGALARKCTAWAMSSGAPTRASGVVATTRRRS